MKNEPRVGIVIVNWNGLNDTRELVDSIKKVNYKNYHIYLVDNNSEDGSKKEFKRLYTKDKKIVLIFNKINKGLSGGFNDGLGKAISDKNKYAFIMNNDMIVDKDFLLPLVGELEKNPKIVACGPRIYYYGDRERIWNTGVKFRLRGFSNLHQNKLDKNVSKENSKVDALDGAYLMRNSTIKEIGLLEEDFFIMHEMTGWCMKAKNMVFFC